MVSGGENMGNVNSQGLTWRDWYTAAGVTVPLTLIGRQFDEMRQAWKAGVDPAEYRFDDLADIAANRGRTENPETGRWE